MGKRLRQKIAEKELLEQKFYTAIARHSYKTKQPVEVIPLKKDIPEIYHAYFINNPDDCKIKTRSSSRYKQMMEVVRFVYSKFPVPKILEQAWLPVNDRMNRSKEIVEANAPCLKLQGMASEDFKKWYICVATGGSLYKDYAKDILTKKEVHTFLTCAFNITLNQAVVYAVAKCAGANEGIALRIAKSKLQEKPFTDFWKDVMKFFSMNCPDEISIINDLLDFFSFKYTENRSYSVLGHGFTLESMKKKMKDWHWAMGRIKAMGDAQWDGFDIPDQIFETKDEYKHKLTWNFIQIKNAKALAQEGNNMRHCVFSYKTRCISGDTSIWSVQTTDYLGTLKKRVTIEVRNTGSIVQVRGLANRVPTSEEKKVIALWAHRSDLIYSSNY